MFSKFLCNSVKAVLLALILISLFFTNSNAQTINAPSNLEAEPENNQYIKVKWDDNSNNEEGFYIERSLVNDTTISWEIIGGVPQNARQFYDYWVTNQITYYYRVYAYADSVRSAYSNVAYATAIIDTSIIPAAPSNLVVVEATQTTITIEWEDNSHIEEGFIIARRKQGELLFKYIDTVETDVLTYQEVGLTPDNLYFYKVCAYNGYGLSDFTNTVSARTTKGTNIIVNSSAIAEGFFLNNNYPNPFNPSTTIKFGIPYNSFVNLNVYNSLGQQVEILLNRNLTSGSYELVWNADNLTSGVYFYRIETISAKGKYAETKRMLLIK